LYVEGDLNQKQMAEYYGCSQATVSLWKKKHGIEKKEDSGPW
jgi:uncharacterized protein YjcR